MAEEIINVELSKELGDNYIEYAEETIKERAIPDIRDGLKPVHLRVLYDMQALGMSPDSKTVKCARIVGDVIGRLNPHGDTSAYGALVGLSQPWSMRYPLITFRGNNGSIDGDPPAAMRYTECKLSKIGYEMTKGFNQDAVDFKPNFDDTWVEPTIAANLVPNYLLNGSEGISCGFAPKIPSHNMIEVYDACLFMLDNLISGKINEIPDDELEDYLARGIMQCIKGPDLPGGGIIIDNKEWPQIIKTGNGKIVTTAKYEIRDTKRKEKQMVITELPYKVNKQALVEKIESLVENHIIEGIKDVVDASEGDDLEILITFKKNAPYDIIINNLLSKTDLKKNVSYNMYGLKNKELIPANILTAIDEFLEHSAIIVQRESQFDYNKKSERLLYVDAMLKVLKTDDTLEKAIKIIRFDKDKKVNNLMSQFDLTEEQAKYIMTRQLNSISVEQHDKYKAEDEELTNDIKALDEIINNVDNALYKEVARRYKELKDKYGDERRTIIDLKEETTTEDLIEDENLIITITSEGNIKSVSESEYTKQKRNGKGSKGVNVKDNEIVTQLFTLSSKDDLLFITNHGRIHHLKAYKIPKVAKTARGRNIVNYISLDEDEVVVKSLATRIKDTDNDKQQYIMFVTDKGQVKKLALNLLSKKRSITKALTLKEGHKLIDAELIEDNDEILIVTSKGNSIRFNTDVIRPQGKTASGVIGIKMKLDNDSVIGLTKVKEGQDVMTISSLAISKKTPESEFTCAKNKGGKGIKCHSLSEKTGDLVGILTLTDEDILLCTQNGKIIRISAADVKKSRRDTTGCKLQNLDKGDYIKSISLAPNAIEEDTDL